MAAPDVTLTDFGLALLCGVFAVMLVGHDGVTLAFALLFGALGLASLFGGVWHGWFAPSQTPFARNLWLATMLAIGGANTMLWLIAGELLSGGQYVVVFRWIAALQLAAYALIAVFVTRKFILPSIASVPPTLLLLLAYCTALPAADAPGLWFGVTGILVAIIGAGLQLAKVGLPALRLSHNGLYHVIQAAAFLLLFLSIPAVETYLSAPG